MNPALPLKVLYEGQIPKMPSLAVSHQACTASFASLSLTPSTNDHFFLHSKMTILPLEHNILFFSSEMRLNYQVAHAVSVAPPSVDSLACAFSLRNEVKLPCHPSFKRTDSVPPGILSILLAGLSLARFSQQVIVHHPLSYEMKLNYHHLCCHPLKGTNHPLLLQFHLTILLSS